jgi:hypothetical protein
MPLFNFFGNYKINLFFFLLLIVLLAFSCKENEPTKPEENNEIRTDTQLIVDKYTLPAGQTEEFPAGFEIIASEGVEIEGTIIIRPDRPGDFTIRVLNGDMNISGKVMVEDDTTESIDKKKNHLSKNGNTKQILENHSLNFILDRPGKIIRIYSGVQIKSGNGIDGLDTDVLSAEKSLGDFGTPGGNIIINAPGGIITFVGTQPAGVPLFILGNGGNGGNISVKREGFEALEKTLEIIGGSGGNSGLLILLADEIEGLPDSPDELNIESELLSGGIGGKGGNAIWDNTIGSPILGYPQLPEDKTYSLEEIILKGGDGGNGAIKGGKGGFAAYWSGRVINERGEQIASVSVTGGNGGFVFYSPIPVALAQGGDGGEYMVLGNFGWSGTDAVNGGPIHGADGGEVTARGGNGGDVLEQVLFGSAIGGDGGNSEIAQTRLVEELQVPFFGFKHPHLWAIGGYGGAGASVCDGCPGGNGGNSGNASAIGGNGGNVPNRVGARGGRGGDVWNVLSSLGFVGLTDRDFGKGGNGNQPGKGGCLGSVFQAPGTGGSGYIPGEDGKFVLENSSEPDCAPDGEICGEVLECVDDGGGGEDSCDQDTTFFTVYAVFEQNITNDFCSIYTKAEFTINGMKISGVWRVIGGSYFDSYNDCNGDTAVTKAIDYNVTGVQGVKNHFFSLTQIVAGAAQPYCHEGILMWGDDPGGIDYELTGPGSITHRTYILSGCNPFGYKDRSLYYCCQRSGGAWTVCN